MCNCENVEIQTYINQVTLLNPFNNRYIGVDKCLADEICELWDNGIETTGCCCGHNKFRPMININDKYHHDMVQLGYKFWINEFEVLCYEPKSV